MKIFGVEILNEGSGVSIDDAVTENAGDLRRPLRRAVDAVAERLRHEVPRK
jgi:hypothetical protein